MKKISAAAEVKDAIKNQTLKKQTPRDTGRKRLKIPKHFQICEFSYRNHYNYKISRFLLQFQALFRILFELET